MIKPSLKLKHWRGSQGKSGWKGTPMLAFIAFMLAAPVIASELPPWQPRITLLLDVRHQGRVLLRDQVLTTPLAPFSHPIVLTNGQPAIVRCESKIVSRAVARTNCQVLSGNEQPAFSKTRWVESRVGRSDHMNFRDRQGADISIDIRLTDIDYRRPRPA